MSELNNSLLDVMKDLKQLIRLQRIKLTEDLLYAKEWYPMYFILGCEGDSSYGKWRYTYYGSNSKKETPLIDKLNTYPFAYQFDSIHMQTQTRNYYPSIRLNINGQLYPCNGAFQFIHKDIGPSATVPGGAFGVYERQTQNYHHGRMFAAWMRADYQSNWGGGDYPFKLKVDKDWVLNFYCYATGTSSVWVHLLINGWKLRIRSQDEIRDIIEVT